MNLHLPPALAAKKALLDTVSIPAWVLLAAGVAAAVDIDFTTGKAFGGTITSLCQCSRASSGYAQNADGSWVSFGNNIPRITTKGLLVEETRTNSFRNNTMVGAFPMADNVELIGNPNFSNSGEGWASGTAGSGSVTFAANSVDIKGDGSTSGNYVAWQITGLTIGRKYIIKVPPGTATFIALVGTAPGGSSIMSQQTIFGSAASANANLDRTGFIATQTSCWVSIARSINTAATLTGVSVMDGECVQNGNFAINPINAAQNTVQTSWQWSVAGGTSSAVWNGVDTVTLTGDGTNTVAIDTSMQTVSGCIYTLTVDIGSNSVGIQIGTVRGGQGNLNSAVSGTGTALKFQFTATSGITWLRFHKTAATAATIKNVSVQSAGKLPDFWQIAGAGLGALIQQVIAVSAEDGLPCLDYRVYGTTSTGNFYLCFEGALNVAASYGQTWALSFFQKLVGGSNTNISNQCGYITRNSGGSSVSTNGTVFTPASSGGLGSNRVSSTYTIVNSTATSLQPGLSFAFANGVAIDTTIRIGMPQLENCNVNSTVASATIAAGGSGGTDGTAVFTVAGGSGTQAQFNVTVSGGVITSINSVVNAGLYTTLPSSPATLVRASGAGVGLTGATVNLTPTNNAALGFITSPIATSSAAVARSSETVTVNGITFAQTGAILLRYAGTPTNTSNAKSRQYGWNYSDAGLSRLSMRAAEASPSSAPNLVVGNGVANSNIFDQSGLAAGTNTGFMAAWNAASSRISQNGRAVVSSATVWSPSVGTLQFSGSLNNYIKRFAYWSRDVTDAGMQQVSVTQ